MPMKKIMTLVAVALTVALTACENKATQEQQAQADMSSRDSLLSVIAQKDNELNDMMTTLNDIQEGFRQINEAEGRVNLSKGQPETSQREEIMENLAFIQRTMQLNRELIARLQQQLKTNTSASSKLKATLEATIEGLNSELEAKNKQMADLTAELEQKNLYIAKQGEQITALNQNVNDLTAQNEAKSRTMAAQDKELHTGWYVFGTKRELKEQNILQRGDVLRSDQFNKDYFTRVDIRVDKVIKLYSKSAKLLTNHPAGSYSLDRDSQGQYTLRITNPQEFWRASRYLVIVVK